MAGEENFEERIQRKVDFLIEMQAKHEVMIGRAFNAIEALADKQAKLGDTMALLADAQVRVVEAQLKTEERFRATDERFRATDERFRATDERFRATDERIDKLTSAIGEFVRRFPEPRA